MNGERLRIVVLGYMVRGPMGGMAWHHLQYVDGLNRLGHDVRFVEDSDDFAGCYDPSRHVVDTDPSFGLRFAADAFGRLGLAEKWSYFDAHSNRWAGAPSAEEFCRSADIVLNVSGANPLRDWTSRPSLRVFVDTDPLFTQVRNLSDEAARSRVAGHNVFFSFGENIGKPSSTIPDDGFDWQPTRQPIVLCRWDVTAAPSGAPYTTVMQWQSYAPVVFKGRTYGVKDSSLRRFIDAPSMTTVPMEIAIGGEDAPREALSRAGWRLENPLEVALSPWDYQRYIAGARGEFTIAKEGYVVSNCGWFSERSAAFLASGRPVITQETGFSEWLPQNRGVFAFSDLAELKEKLAEVERDYEFQRAIARKTAEEFFDSDMVLHNLVDAIVRSV